MIHWTKVKKAVEEAGGVWTDREAGEAFLAGRSAMPADEPDVVFDKSKPYAEISGFDARFPRARYMQNRVYFDAQGKKVG